MAIMLFPLPALFLEKLGLFLYEYFGNLDYFVIDDIKKMNRNHVHALLIYFSTVVFLVVALAYLFRTLSYYYGLEDKLTSSSTKASGRRVSFIMISLVISSISFGIYIFKCLNGTDLVSLVFEIYF